MDRGAQQDDEEREEEVSPPSLTGEALKATKSTLPNQQEAGAAVRSSFEERGAAAVRSSFEERGGAQAVGAHAARKRDREVVEERAEVEVNARLAEGEAAEEQQKGAKVPRTTRRTVSKVSSG